MTTMTNSEQHVATLIFPNEYMRQLNSIAGLTTQNVIFLRRKFVTKEGWELVKYPIGDCKEITYKEDLPVIKIFFGVLLLCLVAFIFVMVAIYWNDLEPNTKVPVGLLGLAGLYGARVAFGGRRHSIRIKLVDGTTLTWKSKSGEHKLMAPIVEKFLEFTKRTGL